MYVVRLLWLYGWDRQLLIRRCCHNFTKQGKLYIPWYVTWEENFVKKLTNDDVFFLYATFDWRWRISFIFFFNTISTGPIISSLLRQHHTTLQQRRIHSQPEACSRWIGGTPSLAVAVSVQFPSSSPAIPLLSTVRHPLSSSVSTLSRIVIHGGWLATLHC
jgi:hypothetical protein